MPTIAVGEVLFALPPDVPASQKMDVRLWDGEEFVAVGDVIVGWLAESVAHIGLLITDGARHAEGRGRMMHDVVIDLVGRKPAIQAPRLSIVDTNTVRAEPFWTMLGYEPSGEAVPHASHSVESTASIWM